MLTHVAQQVRGTIYDISLSAEADRAFRDLLHDLVDVQAGIARGCRVELRGEDALPDVPLGRRGTELLRIVGEALRNARRHSGATTIRVDAAGSNAGVLRLEVSDDGVPRSGGTRVPPARGAGIASMLARADTGGAEHQDESRPGGGTRVCLELELCPV
jgi:signal transduction histidine kinase